MLRRILCFLTCLTLAFAPGCGGKPSVKKLRALASEGDIEAQYQLALRYAAGDGLPVDTATAVGWYRRAAAQGHGEAQLELGRALARGNGVPKDTPTALHWYRQAAERGLRDAQLALGAALLRGGEIPADPVTGLAWLKVAGATPAELEGQSLAGIEAKLTPEQRSAVEKMIQDNALRAPRR